MERTQLQARRQLDDRYESVRSLGDLDRPNKGWIRAIRDALGMSGTELAARMGVSQQVVSEIERNERLATAKLETLARAAEAMDCELVYALVPRTTLEEIVRTQARRKAVRHLAHVVHHGRLEAQEVSEDELAAQVEELASWFADHRGLWIEGQTT
ncbi:MAG: mobile mystery protein A [Acidimicrobiia bacterium]|nr:mobile mystery protein A [Acidimicrobiia bacterium]MYB24708.1 mobile mystery protein A [Acidimicrobiia bacterium]MYJ12879.1 mobile mystery protein A [Acidimicrobiia bacterium]